MGVEGFHAVGGGLVQVGQAGPQPPAQPVLGAAVPAPGQLRHGGPARGIRHDSVPGGGGGVGGGCQLSLSL